MRFVILALDGLRPDMISAEATPHLQALASAGTRFANARSVFPSETRVATPSLVTGCRPGGHGMVANTIFDASVAPDRLLRTKLIADVMAMARGGESPLQRPTIGERLAEAGLSFALVSTGTGGAARLLHPAAERLGGFRWNVEEQDGPAGEAMRARFGPTPPHAVPNIPRLRHGARILLEHVLPELRPDVTLVWLSEPDVSFHWGGLRAPHAREALREADAIVGRVAAWRDAQPDAAEIVLVAMSDHGHVTGRGKLSLAAELRRAGFRAGTGFGPETDIVVAPAAAPGLWFRDPSMIPSVADWLGGQAWCGALLTRDPSVLPDDASLPLSLLGSGHDRSADLVVTFAGSEAPDEWGLPGHAPFDAADVPEGGGMHGGLHRAELATVLVMQGGPIRQAVAGVPCDLTDIAPTILHLLGLSHAGMEGGPLHAAWDAAADAPPTPELFRLPRGLVLKAMRPAGGGRLYPTALRREAPGD
jgi:arylsulfatase A-like enzyme